MVRALAAAHPAVEIPAAPGQARMRATRSANGAMNKDSIPAFVALRDAPLPEGYKPPVTYHAESGTWRLVNQEWADKAQAVGNAYGELREAAEKNFADHRARFQEITVEHQ